MRACGYVCRGRYREQVSISIKWMIHRYLNLSSGSPGGPTFTVMLFVKHQQRGCLIIGSSDVKQFFSPLPGSQNPLSNASSVSIDFPGNTHSVRAAPAPRGKDSSASGSPLQSPGAGLLPANPKLWDKGLIGSFPFSMIPHPCHRCLVLPG